MPIDYLRRLSDAERTPRANRHLGMALAFVAGAANAGGFLAVNQYTSHMTGILSALADDLVLGNFSLALAGALSLGCFLAGAVVTTLLVVWAREQGLRSRFALPLLLEALLLLVFGVMGAHMQQHVALYVSLTVLLLCFMMGLQNAIITKLSNAEIRTTHVTGIVTDVGIGIGRLLYGLGRDAGPEGAQLNRERLRLHLALVGMFFAGALLGAFGFKYLGFQAVLPLAVLLLLFSVLPVLEDIRARYLRG